MTQTYVFPVKTEIQNAGEPTTSSSLATKNYVDNKSATGGFNYDGGFTNIVIDTFSIKANAAISGTTSSIVLNANNNTTAADAAAFFNDPNRAGVVAYQFTGSTIPFTITSASAAGSLVTCVIPSTNFTPAIAANTVLQYFATQSVTDLALGTGLTGAVATNPNGNQTLTITGMASGSSGLIFNVGQALLGDNNGLLVKVTSGTPAVSNAPITINSIGTYGTATFTIPTIPVGYNTVFIGISSSDNTSWGGVGSINGTTGATSIAWIKPPPAVGAYTGSIWIVADANSAIYVADTLASAGAVNPVTTLLLPELTNNITYGNDAIGGSAATATFAPLIVSTTAGIYGPVSLDNATQVSTSGTTVLLPGGGQVEVTKGTGALAIYNQITGRTQATNPAPAAAPLPNYQDMVVSTDGGITFSTPVQYNTVATSNTGAFLIFTFTTIPANITNATQSKWIYVGDSNAGALTYTPTVPVDNYVTSKIANGAVTSLDNIKGAVSLVAGQGIALADNTIAKTITITNTGSGSGISAGNAITFVNNQRGEKVLIDTLSETANRTMYLKIGVTSDTEVNDGGYLGTNPPVKYIGTFNSNEPTEGFGINFPVATTYTQIETIWDVPAYTISITTASAATGFTVLNALFSLSTTGNTGASNPASVANIFPGFTLGQPGSDDQPLVALITPTVTFTGSGTSWTVNIGASRWSGIAQNYSHTATTVDYALFLPIFAGPSAQAAGVQITAATATRNTTGGVRVFVSLPGVGGATPTLQQVVNTGNQLSNASPNIATISLLDTTVTPNRTYSLSAAGGADVPKLTLEGSTSGSIAITAPATTSTYPMVLPASQGNNGQMLVNDGSGNTSWVWPTTEVKAVSLLNVTPLSGTATLVDGVSLAVGDEVGIFGQSSPNAAQNGLYIVSAGAWSKLTTYEYQQVQALNGTANIGQVFVRTSASGNETWVLSNVNTVNLIPSGYGVFAASGDTITARKYDSSSASSSDWFVGQSVWGQGIITGVAYGGLVISAIGAPSGADIVLTLNSSTATWSAGRTLYVLPRNSTFDFPIVSKGGNVIGLNLGSGLSIDSVGRLQATGAGGGANYNNYTYGATAYTIASAFTNSTSFDINGLTTTGLAVGTFISFTVGGFIYTITAITPGATNTTITVGTNINDIVAANAVLYKATLATSTAFSSLSAGPNAFFQTNGTNLQIGTSLNPIFSTAAVLGQPVNSTDVARLTDVQAAQSGFKPQLPCRAVSTSSISGTYSVNSWTTAPAATLTGNNAAASVLTVDGVALAVNDRVLLTAQGAVTGANAGVSNGAYVVTQNTSGGTFILTRPTTSIAYGNSFYITAGTTNINAVYINTTLGTITSTTPLTYAQFSSVTPSSGSQNLQQVLAQGRSATSVVSAISLFSDLTYPLNFSTTAGNTSIAAGSSNSIITLNGSSNTITLGKGASYATVVNGAITSSSETIVGASGNGSLALTSETSVLAKITFGSELQLVGSRVNACNASANYIQINGANAGSGPSVGALGADGNIVLNLFSRGSGGFFLSNGFGSVTLTPAATSYTIAPTAAASQINLSTLGVVALGYQAAGANYITATSIATGSTPSLTAAGADTNVGLSIVSKGSGTVTLGNPQNCSLTITGHLGNALSLAASSVSSTTCGLQLQGQGTGALILGNTASFSGYTITGGQSSLATLVATGGGTTIDAFLHSKGSSSGVYFGNDSNNTKLKVSIAADAAGTQTAFIGGYNPTSTTNVDLVFTTQGAGWVYLLRDSLTGITGANQPKLGLPNAAGSTVMGPGAAGQVLTSNANNGSPYWGPTVRSACYAFGTALNLTTANGTISTASLTQQWDTIGLTVSGNTWSVPANSGRLKVTVVMNVSTTAAASYTAYFSWSTNSGISTSVAFGSGVATSVVQYNAGGFASSATGGTPASATILRPYGTGDAFTNDVIGYLSNSASAQSLFLTWFQNSGGTIAISTQSYILLETVPY